MITIEAKIRDVSLTLPLEAMGELSGKVTRRLWVDHFCKGKALAQLKQNYLRKYKISSTHFNSILSEISAAYKARLAVIALQITDKEAAITATKKTIVDLRKDIKEIAIKIKAIQTYKSAVTQWKAKPRGKKPKMPAKIRRVHVVVLKEKLKKKKFKIHQKNRRLAILKERLSALKKEKEKPSLCFGSKKLFRAQFHKKENSYENHAEWLSDWRTARSSQSFWIGSHEEVGRNRNAKYDVKTKTLMLRLPNALSQTFGERIYIRDLEFSYGNKEFLAALAYEEEDYNDKKKKNILVHKPMSYRIVERKSGLYVQAIFEEAVPEPITSRVYGTVGLDLNADHIGMTEIDGRGNLVGHGTYPFDFKGKSSDQIEAILGDHIATICDHALKVGKSIVYEDLDFQKKKAGLREKSGPAYASMLSSFAYKKFQDLLQSRAKKLGVELIPVNPAFSSVIGYYKYHSYKRLTSHEKAAFVLARRGLRLSERPKTSDARLRTVSICDRDVTTFIQERRSRHIWTYWGFYSKDIRETMKRDPRVYPLPSVDPRRLSGIKASLSSLHAAPNRRGKSFFTETLEMIAHATPARRAHFPSRGERCSLPGLFKLMSKFE